MSASAPFSAHIVNSIDQIDADHWDACGAGNPFVSHAFLSALERSGSASAETGWQPYHIVLKQENKEQALGYMPLYLKSHSYGEYVFDHAWANAYENAGGRYYPKLQSSIPFTPATTPRLLVSSNNTEDGVQEALLNSLKGAVQQLGLATGHLTFLSENEADLAERTGFLHRKDQQFHWLNKDYGSFDDFLARLSSRKRKQIKKERKTAIAADITIEQIRGGEITEQLWDIFFEFYQDTGQRKWGSPYLTREFFSIIGETMPQNILLVMCRRGDKYIAGALNFIGPDTLYGRYWGCAEDHPCLHFETCYYQAIDYAIANKLSRVEAGAQGPHKLARGYEPVITHSAHWIADSGFRDAVERFLRIERADIAAEVNYLADRAPFKKG
jgi:predicted N-acyltransferase